MRPCSPQQGSTAVPKDLTFKIIRGGSLGDEKSKASATYVQPGKFEVVVVGDRKVIEPGIRALNLGPVKTMTVAEVLGP